MNEPDTNPDDQTLAEDEHDARAEHRADRAPTPEEEQAADDNPPIPPESSEAYTEAIERGANVKGEGQVDL
jgi:hypothetical protein